MAPAAGGAKEMFTNLIESDSHQKEFKRRSSFFLATVGAYALILSAAGVASIYAYDAHLEAQNTDLTLLSWVPPVKPATPAVQPHDIQPIHRSAASNAAVDRNVTVAERTNAFARTDDPTKVPDHPGAVAAPEPPVSGPFRFSNRNVDPPNVAPTTSGSCVTCNGTTPVVKVEETPPTPQPVKPLTTQKVSQGVLLAKVISLPQPPYPQLAKQIRIQGLVTVQILVDEQGRVLTAQPVSGHPTLLAAAKEAALRARFTPTKLSGQPVKVQGMITYNFVLQ
jgi:TonB family protein